MNNSFTAKIKTRTIPRRRDTAKTAQIGAHGTDMYWPISAPISFCGQQQDSRACVKIVVENTQLCCSLFYCHSNKQHKTFCHVFLYSKMHEAEYEFNEESS